MRKSILILLLIAITIAIISLANIKRKEEPIDEIQEKGLAIMVYDESKKTYVKSDTFPVGRYELSTSSYCTNGTSIGTYDSETGTVTTIFNKSDKCYYYFDIKKNPIITAVVLNTPGNNNYVGITSVTLDGTYDVDYYVLTENITGNQANFTPSELGSTSYNLWKMDAYESYCATDPTFTVTAYLKDGTKSDDFTLVFNVTCFTGDTLIYSIDGYKRIDEIEIGDKVYSYNENTKKIEINKVTKLFIHDDNRINKIKVDDEIIEVTPDHRMYVKKNGEEATWVRVADIKEGDYLYTDKGRFSKIESIEYEEREEKVYNFEVENTHTYFVTKNNYLVHNAKTPCTGNKPI